VGTLGTQPFAGAQQGQAGQLAKRQATGHLQGFEGGGHAVGDMGVEECGLLGGDDEVDFAEKVEGAAAGHTVDRPDDRLPQVARLRAEVLSWIVEHERGLSRTDVDRLAVFSQCVVAGAATERFVTVDARAERLVAGTGQYHHADVIVASQGPP
jgi:hypothetical protein